VCSPSCSIVPGSLPMTGDAVGSRLPNWGGGPDVTDVRVKNTFLDDWADALRPDDLARSRTAPPNLEHDVLEGEEDGPGFRAHQRAQAVAPPSAEEEGSNAPCCSSSNSSAQELSDRMEACSMEVDESDKVDEPAQSFHSPVPERKCSGEYVEALDNDALGTWICDVDPEVRNMSMGSGDTHLRKMSIETCASQATTAAGPSGLRHVSIDLQDGQEHPAKSCYKCGDPRTPQYLIRSYDDESGCYRVTWKCDARKLVGNEIGVVSPPIPCYYSAQHPNVIFKMMIEPIADHNTFKKALGKGIIQLKCEGDLSKPGGFVSVKFSVGQEPWRPENKFHQHNFAQGAVCSLPKTGAAWDFNKVINDDGNTFDIHLSMIVPGIRALSGNSGDSR